MTRESEKRRVFISYCHTSQEHKKRVLGIATHLTEIGIDVVIDEWDLKPGMDLFDFMEEMVKSDEIDKVLVLSDAKYAEKADNREGGVGAESQILTPDVYRNVKQTKVIPVSMSQNTEGTPARPKYLTSRLYIDFSTPDAQLQNFDQLVRAILDQPVSMKPKLGAIPERYTNKKRITAHYSALVALENAIISNSLLWKQKRDKLIGVLNDEINAIYENINSLSYEELVSVLVDSAQLRNVVTGSIKTLLLAGLEDEAYELTVQILEKALTNRGTGHRLPRGKDHYGHFLHILFIEISATILQVKSYSTLNKIITRTYTFKDKSDRWCKVGRDGFYFYGDLIDSWNNANEQKHRIPHAHLHYNHRGESDVEFSEYTQADFLLFVQRVVRAQHTFWYPITLTYTGYSDSYEIFMRADESSVKEGLLLLFEVESIHELVAKWDSSLDDNSDKALSFYFDVDYNRLLNRDYLASL